MGAPSIRPLLTVDEAATLLRLDATTVRRLASRGELVAYRLGRAVRLCPDSLERYLSQRRVHVPRPVPEATSVARTSTAAPAAPAGPGAPVRPRDRSPPGAAGAG